MRRPPISLSISRSKLNLLANFAGAGWSTLMGLAFIPVYIRFVGIEAYGLLGFYVALQSVLQILDLGLSPTMNREIARYSVWPEKAAEARDFARTLEIGYWITGLGIGAALYALAPFIATQWIQTTSLPTGTVVQALQLMALLACVQWPFTLYQGGLLGLQQQVPLNLALVITATLNHVGAALALWLIAPSITTLLIWQAAVSAVRLAWITLLFWRHLPPASRAPRFQAGLLRDVRRFAAGMGGITLTALILTQLDKLILSRLLTLEAFGYYTLAGVVVTGLGLVATSLFNVVFPRLSAMVAAHDLDGIRRFYHVSAQVMSVAILPIALTVAAFSFEVFSVWTGNPAQASRAAPIASLLAIGSALNSLMVIPYALQLAHGWTGLGLRINLLLIGVALPSLLALTVRYGAVGAAGTWIIINGVYMLIGVPLTHRRLLRGEGWRWLVQDVAAPLMAAFLIVVIGRTLLTASAPPLLATSSLLLIWIAALVALALISPALRAMLVDQVSQWTHARRIN